MRSYGFQRLLKIAVWFWAILCGVYFLWEALSYRGLFGRLAELQIGNFGSYVPLLTYLFPFAVAVVPVWLVSRLVLRRSEDDLEPSALIELRLGKARRLRVFLAAMVATTLTVALGFAIYAFWALPDESGRLQTIAASEFGAIPIEEGPVRLVGGELGTTIFFGQEWFIGDDRMAFSPYRPSIAPEGLVHVFVQLEAKNKSDLDGVVQGPSWSGILVKGGLPGTVRVLFNYLGVGIAAEHYTLYKNEESLTIRYWLQAIQWTILGAFLLLLVAIQTRTIRKIEKERTPATA